MEIATTPRHRLLNAIDDEARHVEAVLDVNMNTRQAVQNAKEPQQQGTTGALGGPDDCCWAVEDAGAHHAINDETGRREETQPEAFLWCVGDDGVRVGRLDELIHQAACHQMASISWAARIHLGWQLEDLTRWP